MPGQSTTTKRDYRVMQRHELVDLVDELCEGLPAEATIADVITWLDERDNVIVYRPIANVRAKHGQQAQRHAANGMPRPDDPVQVELVAVPERNWSEAPWTLKPSTDVSAA